MHGTYSRKHAATAQAGRLPHPMRPQECDEGAVAAGQVGPIPGGNRAPSLARACHSGNENEQSTYKACFGVCGRHAAFDRHRHRRQALAHSIYAASGLKTYARWRPHNRGTLGPVCGHRILTLPNVPGHVGIQGTNHERQTLVRGLGRIVGHPASARRCGRGSGKEALQGGEPTSSFKRGTLCHGAHPFWLQEASTGSRTPLGPV